MMEKYVGLFSKEFYKFVDGKKVLKFVDGKFKEVTKLPKFVADDIEKVVTVRTVRNGESKPEGSLFYEYIIEYYMVDAGDVRNFIMKNIDQKMNLRTGGSYGSVECFSEIDIGVWNYTYSVPYYD